MSSERWSRGHWILLAAIVGAGAALRIAAACNDLWLDEIWTLKQVREAELQSVFDVFTRIDVENHALQTMWVFLVGPTASAFVYRLPAVVAAIALIPVCAWIVHQQWRTPIAGLLAAGLVAFSYLQVHYGSEARGYAPALTLAMLAFACLLRGSGHRSAVWPACYTATLFVAIVAQPMALNMLLAAGAWTLVHRWRRAGLAHALRRTGAWHGPPALLFLAYYLLYLRHLRTGGGPTHSLAQVINDAFAYTLGLPVAATAPWLGFGAGLAVLVGCLALFVSMRDDRTVFYATGVLLAPLVLITVRSSPYVFERYFVLNSLLLTMLVAHALAWWWSRGRAGRGLAMAVVIAMLAGSTGWTVDLLRHGRGAYGDAVRLIDERTPTGVIVFAGDHTFRIGVVMRHHFGRALPQREVRQVERHEKPDWLIAHSLTVPLPPVMPEFEDRHGRFERAGVFPYARLSGWHSAVYRRTR